MKKILFIISLFLLILSGCSNNTLKQNGAINQISPDENKEMSVVSDQYKEAKKIVENEDIIFVLKNRRNYSDINYDAIKEWANNCTGISELENVFKPINGDYVIYNFTAKYKGLDYFYGHGRRYVNEENTASLIVKSNKYNNILDAYVYLHSWDECPRTGGIHKMKTDEYYDIVNRFDIGNLKMTNDDNKILDRGTLVLSESEKENKETIDLKIFFSTYNDNEGLMDVHKTEYVVRTVPADSHIATVALEQLFIGPTEEEIENGIIPFWKRFDMSKHLKDVQIMKSPLNENGDNFFEMTAYVNWKESLLDIGEIGTSAGGVLFGSPIDDTLLALPDVTKVINAVEGRPELLIQHMQGSCEYQDEGICDTAPFDSGNEDVINLGYKLVDRTTSNYKYEYNGKMITVDEIRELITDNDEGLYRGTGYITANSDGSVIYFSTSIMDEKLGFEKTINKIYSYNLGTNNLKFLLEIEGMMNSYHPIGMTGKGLLIISKHSGPLSDPCVMSEWTGHFSSIYSLDINSKNPKLEYYDLPKYIIKRELNDQIRCMIKIGNY